MPNKKNKDDIFRLTDQTRHNRQTQIRYSGHELTLSSILHMYPRFTDYNDELVRHLCILSSTARTYS